MTDKDPPKTPDLLDWLCIRKPPDWARARWVGAGVSVFLFLLLTLAAVALFVVLIQTVRQGMSPASTGPNLGAGALIAALLGAPFVIWATWLKHRTVTFQKEGHITDRINKAVEMLGAEKKVDRIGRPVTIWTGKPETVSVHPSALEIYKDKPRTKIAKEGWVDEWIPSDEQVDLSLPSAIRTWPSERTVIDPHSPSKSLISLS